ncbi:3-methyl-2-oxobutanoate hydroxymethyltransferase [bacterium]|nr:3-methyl-2-oxobutanoate hydroxymethyltransferase [bacterium]
MTEKKNSPVTITDIQAKKGKKEKIVSLTAYDFPVAKIVSESGVDLILVGDSLGMVVLGYENTIPVTMDEMIHHTKAVVRASPKPLVVGDMPYYSFHISEEETLRNAFRFLKEGGAQAVKVEGASPRRLKMIETMVDSGIPVMGHVGLTPQSIHQLGHFRVQGKQAKEAKRIASQAQNLEKAGVFSVILECIPMELSRVITEKLKIPTIGIGAGPYCDGQILVFHDLVGYAHGYLPKFVKRYAHLHSILSDAVQSYIHDVKEKKFPDDPHSYHVKSSKILDEVD